MKRIKILALLILLTGCGKEFLDVKRDANQVVPHSVKDYLAILHRFDMLRTTNQLSFIGADEYYIKNVEDLNSGAYYAKYLKNAYAWSDHIFTEEEEFPDWNRVYEAVMYANLALDVEKIKPKPEEQDDWNRVRAAARFYRAWNYYHLAQQFCEVYDPATAKDRLGLQLRLDYDVSIHYGRGTLEEVYAQILKDLMEAEEIGMAASDNIYLPGKTAVQALLARIYLQMGEYGKAADYAQKVLAQRSELVDYNGIEGRLEDYYQSHFDMYGANNPSIIFYSYFVSSGLLDESLTNVDTVFIKSLSGGDLRKSTYFFETEDGRTVYTGAYCGEGAAKFFTGLSVEEALLIRAECHARNGKKDLALDDLNLLRSYRIKKEQFKPLLPEEVTDVVKEVLDERRKELFMRGMRWEDARRLNREGKYAQRFRRDLEGEVTVLLPDSRKWVWPIPPHEIKRSNIVQNPR